MGIAQETTNSPTRFLKVRVENVGSFAHEHTPAAVEGAVNPQG